MRRNQEIVLQNKLLIRHDLIEKGLTLIERESVIHGRKRCDILFKDREGKKLYIEIKEVVDDKAIEQILRYRTLVEDNNSRFMLVANYPIDDIYQLKLQELQIEYMNINKNDTQVQLKNIVEIPKGNSIHRTKENIIKKLNKQGTIAVDIYEYIVNNLHTLDTPIICNISDGVMFQLVQCNEKFLSISTIGNRLLFHFPNGDRDSIYTKYKITIPELYRYKDKYSDNFHKDTYKDKEPNQIDIKLKHVTSLDYIKPLIDETFKQALMSHQSHF
ncbi:endonuclease NucS domain-containing protein [Bacillus cereus group sp. Bce005]|uniref:endonuclease NucS domain-containing protein n=1 Tax=Bacillus cereus group sp. Bce005 TaxID=3445256 RepID=UPI003F28A3E8